MLPRLRIVFLLALPLAAQTPKPDSVAISFGPTWRMVSRQFVSLAEAMPADKYAFKPTAGAFDGARSFGEQVKHVACANYGFFNEIEGKEPPANCATGGPNPAKTKDELVKYLRDSFDYAERILSTVDAKTMLDRVTGPYGAPNTRLGVMTVAVWHASDHYGQLVEYARLCGIVPPASR